MGRTPKTNQVPRAPFSLIDTGPLPSAEVYSRVGFKWFVAANGAAVDARATTDAKSCPYCDAVCEWALTVKRDASAPKGKINYVYARCTAHPAEHRWGLSDTPESRALPIPKPAEFTPTPEEHETMTAPAAAGSFDALIAAVVDASVGARLANAEDKLKELAKTSTLDPEAIRTMITEALANARKVEITIPAMPTLKFTGKAHKVFERLIKLITAGVRFIMLRGPAATGKSQLGHQIAAFFKKRCTALSVNATVTREEILGWTSPNLTGGPAKYTPSAIVEGWERGDVILIDEWDRGDANTMVAFNSIEQGLLYVPRSDAEGGSCAKMGEGGLVIATANTYGTGADRVYVGANQLDASTLDRFFVVDVGYDHDLEIEITGSPEAVSMMEQARTRAQERSVRRPMTTRMIKRALVTQAVDGGELRAAFKANCEACGWTRTELDGVWA